MDLPCYSSPAVQDDFRKEIWESCRKILQNQEFLLPWKSYKKRESYDEAIEMVKILAPLTDNPNPPDSYGITPIYWAAFQARYYHVFIEIVKILAPLTDNPNAPNHCGITPIYIAADDGQSEIVKILAPLTDNPNAPNYFGETPIQKANENGHTEIVKFLSLKTRF